MEAWRYGEMGRWRDGGIERWRGEEQRSLVENMVFCNTIQNDKKCPMR